MDRGGAKLLRSGFSYSLATLEGSIKMEELHSKYLSINDLSTYLGIKPKTIYARVKEIPHYKVGRLIRFKQADIDAWMEQHRVAKEEKEQQQAQEPPKTATERTPKPPKARRSMKRRGPITDTKRMARNTIDQVTAAYYSSGHGKSDQVKGSGKED
jgi:excisionase family DNA binding protein